MLRLCAGYDKMAARPSCRRGGRDWQRRRRRRNGRRELVGTRGGKERIHHRSVGTASLSTELERSQSPGQVSLMYFESEEAAARLT